MEVVKVTQSQTQETGLVVNNDSVARKFFLKMVLKRWTAKFNSGASFVFYIPVLGVLVF